MDEAAATLCDPQQSDEPHDAGPPPLQFRLKTLLALTAVLSVAFATMGRLSALWAAALAWFLLLVAGHVAANAMGTRAVDHVSARLRRKKETASPNEPFDLQQASAPTTRLGSQNRLGIGMAVIIGIGATIGCVVGTLLILLHTGGELSLPAFVLGAVSSTGVGAFLSFLAGSFAKVASKAIHEASLTADPRR